MRHGRPRYRRGWVDRDRSRRGSTTVRWPMASHRATAGHRRRRRSPAWLEANVAGAVGPVRRSSSIAGGHSNLTFRVTDADGRRYVLRRPPLGHVLATAHDMGREHRIIAALGPTRRARRRRPSGCCDDDAVNGAPFYVMGFVDGLVLRDRDDGRARSRPRHARRPPASRSSTPWPPSTPSTSTPSASATSAARRATSPAS